MAGGWNAWPLRLEGISISAETIAAAAVGAVFGGAGLVGLVFAYMRRFIDKRLEQRESESKKARERRVRQLTLEDEMSHATGRLFFFMHKAIVTGAHNGDLEAAWAEYQDVERRKKALDREILVENEIGSG